MLHIHTKTEVEYDTPAEATTVHAGKDVITIAAVTNPSTINPPVEALRQEDSISTFLKLSHVSGHLRGFAIRSTVGGMTTQNERRKNPNYYISERKHKTNSYG